MYIKSQTRKKERKKNTMEKEAGLKRLHASNTEVIYSHFLLQLTITLLLDSAIFYLLIIIMNIYSFLQKINNAVVPKWLIVMLKTRFFNTCMAHHGFKKNEMDRFCIDCHSAFCQNCLPSHTPHLKISHI